MGVRLAVPLPGPLVWIPRTPPKSELGVLAWLLGWCLFGAVLLALAAVMVLLALVVAGAGWVLDRLGMVVDRP